MTWWGAALPLSVSVTGGRASVVNVRLSPGATVQGRVLLAWPAAAEVAGKLIVPDAPVLATLVMRLSGPEASYKAPLAEDGTFSLGGVQPGTYDVVVSEDGVIPATFQLSPVTQDVEIEDGGELKLN